MIKKIATASVAALLLLTGCSAEPAEETRTAVQKATVSSPAKGPNPTLGRETPETGSDPVSDQSMVTTAADTRPRGLTDRQRGEPTPINSTISRCARSSEGLYEQGTTWFTDGTSGWTEQCSATFWDGPPPANTVAPVQPEYEPEPIPSGRIVTAGAWCGAAEVGQVGYTSGGNQMVCMYEPSNDVHRWK